EEFDLTLLRVGCFSYLALDEESRRQGGEAALEEEVGRKLDDESQRRHAHETPIREQEQPDNNPSSRIPHQEHEQRCRRARSWNAGGSRHRTSLQPSSSSAA